MGEGLATVSTNEAPSVSSFGHRKHSINEYISNIFL